MKRPLYKPGLEGYAEEIARMWGLVTVFTTAPALADMKVGEVALGNATESSPAAGSHALYFKPLSTKIMVIATNGTNTATRAIT